MKEKTLRKERKRTRQKLKERMEKAPGVVFVKEKRKNQDKIPIEKQGPNSLPDGEYQVQTIPETKEIVGGIEITNGVKVNPAMVAAIKAETDVKVAKKIAKIATSWYRKLYGLEEIRMVQAFKPGDDVWWTWKKFANTGQVVRLKTRKLVIKVGVTGEHVVLPVRKVKKGPVPKEYLYPDPKRWRLGRTKGGDRQSAEAVVQ